jgi:large subunit ribosomal protein L10
VANPRPDKVAVVDDVRVRLEQAEAALLTEYRGLNVTMMAQLRRSLREAGGEYKIYKNTLVRLAARDLGLEIDDMLVGPTAIAFVAGDPVNVAKALRDFARTNPALVVKGGLLGRKFLDADQTRALADIAPREELLARMAGAMAAPLQQLAGLLQALPRNFAYGLAALVDKAPPADTAAPADATEATEAANATEATEGSEATTEATEATDTAEAADATEATDIADTAEAADATEATDTPDTAPTDTETTDTAPTEEA